jgi:hypothetical protein
MSCQGDVKHNINGAIFLYSLFVSLFVLLIRNTYADVSYYTTMGTGYRDRRRRGRFGSLTRITPNTFP